MTHAPHDPPTPGTVAQPAVYPVVPLADPFTVPERVYVVGWVALSDGLWHRYETDPIELQPGDTITVQWAAGILTAHAARTAMGLDGDLDLMEASLAFEREALAQARSIRQTEAWRNPPAPADPTSILDEPDPLT